jgi:hypothetical protein
MSLVKKDEWWVETRNFKKTVKEEYLDINETLVELENNSNVIRLELNTIELPLFSKDPKRIKNQIKVYHFKTDKSSYLEIEAPANYSIPGEFEERVFIALTKIMKNNNYNRKFVVSANEILETLGLENKVYYKRIREALTLLSKTNYTFLNSLYSNKESGIIEKKIMSNIMNITIISKKDKRAEEIEAFEDGRIKEVYEINFTDYFYENIIRKGYLAFDSEKLLSIENSIARAIYTIVEKWRGYDLYIKRQAFFIARRIPLRWDKTQIKRTIDTMEKALIKLQELNLIKDYKIIKGKKWELTEIEITYEEFHNKTKRETFFKEKNEFTNIEMLVTSTEEKIKCIETEELKNNDNDVSKILNLFPSKVLEMKTFEKFIKDSVKEYGFDYVNWTSEYTILKNPTSYKSYLSKALDGNWADEYIANKKNKENKKNKQIEEENKIEEAILIEEKEEIKLKYIWEDFLNLDEDLRLKIENAAYENFLDEANSLDNKIMRGIFEKSKKSLILKIMELENFEKKEIEVEIEKEYEKEYHGIYESKKDYINLVMFISEILNKCVEIGIKIDKEKLENIKMMLEVLNEYRDTQISAKWIENKKGLLILFK